MKVLVKHIDYLKKFQEAVPEVIEHPYIAETSKKSEFAILDLLDKSENKSDDMISIMQHIHEHYVAHTMDAKPIVVEQKVFGGDVLTTERTFSAQQAMKNAKNDYLDLSGVVPRPEGLHRMMNFLMV